MSPATAAIPPAVVVFALATGVAVLPRRAGHAVAAAGGLLVAAWLLSVPAGAHATTALFGFEAVLFHVDGYSRPLGVTFGVIVAAGVGYLFATGADNRQTAFALAYVGAGAGAAFAGDWLSLVVFWELMAVGGTVLIWHRASDPGAGFRYAVYHELGALALIAGVLLHYDRAGTFVYADGIAPGLPALLAGLGIGLNAGVLGLHVWLVDAYPRTHVGTSVVLAAITTKVGAYAILRAFPDGHALLAALGGAMVLFGVTFAVLQTDVRRLLSYHIVSQVGYIVAGFGAGTALARAGAMAHLVNNILYKSLLFMVAGVLVLRTGRETLGEIRGLGRSMPLAAGVFLVAAFSIAGLPGFNGFVSKGMVIDGVEAAGFEVLWYVLVVGGVGTVVSFAKFGYYAFLYGTPPADHDDLDRVGLVVLGGVAALCVLLGLVPSILLSLLPAEGIAGAKPFAASQFAKTGAVTATGLGVFVAIRARLRRITPVPDLDAVYEPLGRWLRDAGVRGAIAVETGIDRVGRLATARAWPFVVGSAAVTGTSREDGLGPRHSIGMGVLAMLAVLVLLLVLVVV